MSTVNTKREHDAYIERHGCEPSWHRKPPPEVRSVVDALADADRCRNELPRIVQVHARDWDKVILADEIERLKAWIATHGARK